MKFKIKNTLTGQTVKNLSTAHMIQVLAKRSNFHQRWLLMLLAIQILIAGLLVWKFQ